MIFVFEREKVYEREFGLGVKEVEGVFSFGLVFVVF